LAGYEDANDVERLSVDPAMRCVVGGRARDHQAASTSQMRRFETEILTARKDLKALMNLPGMWIDHVRQQTAGAQIILDLDSSVSETYDNQEGSAYNEHFGCTCDPGKRENVGRERRLALYNGSVRSGSGAGRSNLENVGQERT
jgi:hypothetical protein